MKIKDFYAIYEASGRCAALCPKDGDPTELALWAAERPEQLPAWMDLRPRVKVSDGAKCKAYVAVSNANELACPNKAALKAHRYALENPNDRMTAWMNP